jgi:hypothetical protein
MDKLSHFLKKSLASANPKVFDYAMLFASVE